jgi:hypothetical protein
MGTWNTKIDGNDTFQDMYQEFFSRYNFGLKPKDVSEQILNEFSHVFNDQDDMNNGLFALAKAQWETKSLDQKIFKRVEEIIENGQDLLIWKSLGADDKTINERKKELTRFLDKISTERSKPKRRIKPKLEFELKNVLKSEAPDGLKSLDINEEFTNKNL